MRLEGLSKLKNQLAPWGIKPVIFLIVTKDLWPNGLIIFHYLWNTISEFNRCNSLLDIKQTL
jgi:hypothetical protein